MIAKEILDGNNIIANFMGLTIPIMTPAYYQSWDWLMPVVEKIEKSGHYGMEVSIIDKQCEIGTMGYQYSCIAFGKGDTKIESVWLACTEFIKWYNNEQTKVS